MQKLTVADAAKFFDVSKEAIYNRIRRNTIDSVIEKGVRYVIVSDEIDKNAAITPKPATNKAKDSSEFIEYLKKEIAELKEKNRLLQNDKERLYEEKEQILLEGKKEIKELYLQRDKKLQYFIELLGKPLNGAIEDKSIETAYTIEDTNEPFWVELSEFLDKFNSDKKRRKQIKSYILENIHSLKEIKIEDGKFYVDQNSNLELMAK